MFITNLIQRTRSRHMKKPLDQMYVTLYKHKIHQNYKLKFKTFVKILKVVEC